MKLAYTVVLLMIFSSHAKENQVELKYGFDEKGAITKNWVGYSPNKHSNEGEDLKYKPLTSIEKAWAKLITNKINLWQTQLDKI